MFLCYFSYFLLIKQFCLTHFPFFHFAFKIYLAIPLLKKNFNQNFSKFLTNSAIALQNETIETSPLVIQITSNKFYFKK